MTSSSNITALILAGGRGTRIAALTPNTPKPMVPVAGEPFLEWVVRRLLRENIKDIVISIGHLADVVENWVQRRTPCAGETLRCHREAQPLGTGGAVADALPHITTTYVLILNGDTLLLCDFLPALDRLKRDGLHGIIMARSLEDTGRYGRLGVHNSLLTAFEEKQPGCGLINGGIYLFQTDWLRNFIKPGISSMETDIFPAMLTANAKIGIEVTDAPFIDIGTPATLAEASSFVATHKESF